MMRDAGKNLDDTAERGNRKDGSSMDTRNGAGRHAVPSSRSAVYVCTHAPLDHAPGAGRGHDFGVWRDLARGLRHARCMYIACV